MLGKVMTQPLLNVQDVDMKKKYGASWGLVTGGSSGIGKAIAEKLAKQKINVVIVSLDDDLLKNTTTELKERFPDVEFRAIGVDLSGSTGDYLQVCIAIENYGGQWVFNGEIHAYMHAAFRDIQVACLVTTRFQPNFIFEGGRGYFAALPGP